MKSTKSDDVSGGGRDGADHKKDDDHAENKGELHEVFRENMSLRLRLLSGISTYCDLVAYVFIVFVCDLS